MNRTTQPQGMSYAGYILVLFLLLVVGALLYSAFERAGRDYGFGNGASCLCNLKQLGIAFRIYESDYNGFLPSTAAFGAKKWTPKSDWTFRTQRGRLPVVPGRRVGTYAELLYPYLMRVTGDRHAMDLLYCPDDGDSRNMKGPHSPVSYVMKKAVHQAWWGVGMPKGQVVRNVNDYLYPADQMLLYERRNWHRRKRPPWYWPFGGEPLVDAAVRPSRVPLHVLYLDARAPFRWLPDPLNGEPDYYNTDAKTGKPVKAKVDPRRYCDSLY